MGRFRNIVNAALGLTPNMLGDVATRTNEKHDMNNRIIRYKLERIKQDIASWRRAISEAENTFYPNRLSLQQLYLDTVLNGHVKACMRERKDLTLLKDFAFMSGDNKVNKATTDLLKHQWFYDLIEFVLDAQFYGYSLANWTEVRDNKLHGLHLIRRWNVSPDREQILPFPNSLLGEDIFKDEFIDWSLYVKTISESGISKCGMGLLLSVAPYEIYLRNLMGFNGTYVELFSQPFRHGKTDKTEGAERDLFEQAVSDMGASAYIITDTTDEIEFLDTGGSGTGYKSYESFQERNEKTISKLFFGHSDAIDSRTGKLGSEQGEDSPVSKAIRRTEASDARFVESVINDQFIDKLISLGFNIPKGLKFKLLNNKEEAEEKSEKADYNQKVATMVKTFSDSGYDTDPAQIEEMTGIKLTKKEVEEIDDARAESNFKKAMNKYYP